MIYCQWKNECHLVVMSIFELFFSCNEECWHELNLTVSCCFLNQPHIFLVIKWYLACLAWSGFELTHAHLLESFFVQTLKYNLEKMDPSKIELIKLQNLKTAESVFIVLIVCFWGLNVQVLLRCWNQVQDLLLKQKTKAKSLMLHAG